MFTIIIHLSPWHKQKEVLYYMKKSQKPLIMLAAGAAALVMSVSAAISLSDQAAYAEPPDQAVLNPSPPCLYTVGELNGVIAVFSGSDGKLLMLTDHPVAALPSADRNALSKGIPISSDEELSMLLEDYQ